MLGTLRKIEGVASLIRARIALGRYAAGQRQRFGKGVAFSPPRGAKIEVGERVSVGAGCGFGFTSSNPHLKIGARTYLQPRSRINVSESVIIGSDCAISWDVDIMDTDFHQIIPEDGNPLPVVSPVIIGDRVWIGVGAKILKGSEIGSDSIVAAGSVVMGKFPSHSLIAGVPAERKKAVQGWKP